MLGELFIRAAGADPNRFDGIEHEQTRYAALGAALLVPPLLGGIAIHSTARYLGNPIAVSVTFALIWAIVIFTIDRVLVVTTLRRVPGEPLRLAHFLAIIFRVLLAGFVGFGIGFCGKLALSAKSAKQEIAEDMRRRTLQEEAPLREELRRIDGLIATINQNSDAEIAQARERLSDAVSVRTLEAQGVGGSRRYGDQGPGYRAADAEVRARQTAIANLEAARAQKLQPLLAERAAAQARIQQLGRDIAAADATDILAQVRALERVL